MTNQNNSSAPAELLPCPMCGSADVAHEKFEDDDHRDFVMCNGCGLLAQRCDCEADPLEVWNRRSTQPAVDRAQGGLTLPRAFGVSRDAESPGGKGVLVSFERALSDAELRTLHTILASQPAPAQVSAADRAAVCIVKLCHKIALALGAALVVLTLAVPAWPQIAFYLVVMKVFYPNSSALSTGCS